MNFGAIFSKKDVRDYKIKVAGASNVELPESYECKNMPEALNQGGVSSCVAHALAIVVQWHSTRQGDSNEQFSTAYIYGNRMNSTYEGEGMYTRDAVDAVKKWGTCEKKYLPKNIEVPDAIKYFEDNFDKAFENAYPFRFTSYVGLGSDENTKISLIKYGPVIMAMNWYSDLWIDKYNVIHTTQERKNICGAHCMVIYGWNKDGWLVQNSWGKSWGNNGRCIIPYDIKIREKYQIIDEYSEKEQKARIAELEKSNNDLRQQICKLSEQIKILNETLDKFSQYKELSEEQIIEISNLMNQISAADEKIAELMKTIEEQQKEINALKEKLEIVRPFDSKIGKFFAKIINSIITIFEWFLRKK